MTEKSAGPILFERDQDGNWKPHHPVISATLTLNYPSGSVVSEEIGEILTVPPEDTYGDFVQALCNLLHDTADELMAEYLKNQKEFDKGEKECKKQ